MATHRLKIASDVVRGLHWTAGYTPDPVDGRVLPSPASAVGVDHSLFDEVLEHGDNAHDDATSTYIGVDSVLDGGAFDTEFVSDSDADGGGF